MVSQWEETAGLDVVDLSIPPERSDLVALLHASARILESRYQADGTFEASVRMEENQRKKLAPFILENQKECIYNQPPGAVSAVPALERSLRS